MFRFRIRDILWLTVIVAMGVGWWMDHHTQARAAREATFDAFTMARLTSGRVLGLESSDLVRLQKKYGADPDEIATLRRVRTKQSE